MHGISVIMILCSIGCFSAAIVQRRWPSAILGLIILAVAVPMFLLTML